MSEWTSTVTGVLAPKLKKKTKKKKSGIPDWYEPYITSSEEATSVLPIWYDEKKAKRHVEILNQAIDIAVPEEYLDRAIVTGSLVVDPNFRISSSAASVVLSVSDMEDLMKLQELVEIQYLEPGDSGSVACAFTAEYMRTTIGPRLFAEGEVQYLGDVIVNNAEPFAEFGYVFRMYLTTKTPMDYLDSYTAISTEMVGFLAKERALVYGPRATGMYQRPEVCMENILNVQRTLQRYYAWCAYLDYERDTETYRYLAENRNTPIEMFHNPKLLWV